MLPADAVAEITSGKPRPAYLVLGEEQVLADRVVTAARAHVVEAALAGFNVDVFDATDAKDVHRAIESANTMPMMARRRLVVLRGLERLDKAGEEKPKVSPTDALADYLEKPSPSTCLVLVATKVDGRRRLSTVARKHDLIVACDPLKPHQLPSFVRDEAKRRGNPIGQDVASGLVDLVGFELAGLVDAVERLSLYVGAGKPIDEDAVIACIARVRVGSVWGLSDALVAGDRATALRLLDENYDARDRGLPLLGILASAMRKTLKMRVLLDAGASVDDAAKRAGVAPFKARDTAAQVRKGSLGDLERAIQVLAEADVALKGSKRPPLLVLEEAILRMTARPARPS
ncbi:MAG: DNA polymerase III subunit delta [Myxococcales bacterium]|nr:DNA polymerase III subunit delta [Myxococcales bacterium]